MTRTAATAARVRGMTEPTPTHRGPDGSDRAAPAPPHPSASPRAPPPCPDPARRAPPRQPGRRAPVPARHRAHGCGFTVPAESRQLAGERMTAPPFAFHRGPGRNRLPTAPRAGREVTPPGAAPRPTCPVAAPPGPSAPSAEAAGPAPPPRRMTAPRPPATSARGPAPGHLWASLPACANRPAGAGARVMPFPSPLLILAQIPSGGGAPWRRGGQTAPRPRRSAP